MSNPWGKFFWQDWESDPALKLCSLAAQGLWMRMLCIAATHDPIGYVAVAGIALDETGLARLTGAPESEVRSLLGELDRTGVFSRDAKHRIYSRRMIRDARKAATARKNGKKGGNPSLGNNKGKTGSDNLQDKGGLKPHKPEARSQSSSDNKLSGAQAPDSDKAFWDSAKAYLGKAKAAHIGKWVRDYGKGRTAAAIAQAQAERAVDAVPYIEVILRKPALQAVGGEGW
jgi:hypothetical protein